MQLSTRSPVLDRQLWPQSSLVRSLDARPSVDQALLRLQTIDVRKHLEPELRAEVPNHDLVLEKTCLFGVGRCLEELSFEGLFVVHELLVCHCCELLWQQLLPKVLDLHLDIVGIHFLSLHEGVNLHRVREVEHSAPGNISKLLSRPELLEGEGLEDAVDHAERDAVLQGRDP